MSIHKEALIGGLTLIRGLSACNGPNGPAGQELGRDQVSGSPALIPPNTPPATGAGGGGPNTAKLGDTCGSTDKSQICLALKYVVYTDSAGAPVVDRPTALANLASINSIWSQCNIAFQIDDFVELNPADYGLTYNTPTMKELSTIRSDLSNSTELLVVTTGAWAGSWSGSANAWTAMPSGGPFGVVLEGPVGNFGPIIAHELGHYLNLGHVNDSSDVMNAIISTGSTGLTTQQCTDARAAAGFFWIPMSR